MMTRTGKFLAMLTTCGLLVGCGLKGDLYLEEEATEAENAAAEAEEVQTDTEMEDIGGESEVDAEFDGTTIE